MGEFWLSVAAVVVLIVKVGSPIFAVRRFGRMSVEIPVGFPSRSGPLRPLHMNVLFAIGLILEMINDRHGLIFRNLEEREIIAEVDIAEIVFL
jgi:hypothetical protein